MYTRQAFPRIALAVALAFLINMAGIGLPTAQAAALTSVSDTMSTLKESVVANHDIQFTTPTGISASQTIAITFTDFSVAAGLDSTDIDLLDDGAQLTLAASPSGTTWGAVRTSATVITLTNGSAAVAAGSVVRIKIGTNATEAATGDQQITSPAAGTATISIAGTMTDSGSISANIISNDQVSVSATVAQSISFALGSNSVSLGTLSSSAATSSTHTMTIATNAPGGMVATVSGLTLTSGSNTISACGSGCASTTGSEQFGINLKDNATPNVGAEASGSAPIGSAATNYDTADSFRFVTGETIASSAAGINSTVFTISYLANISGATEAGTYTTTLTYTVTGTF